MASYLIRCDDLCPTMDPLRWARMMDVIDEFALKPILAVVPENQDRELELAPPSPAFWSQMRRLQRAGASIALHGYRHLCASKGNALLPLHRYTEFAGVPEELQRRWMHEGMEILRRKGLEPRLFVAPRHGFDCATLRALRAEGIIVLSDGFARRAFLRDELIWLPQQLWAPAAQSHGLWTICLHPNAMESSDVDALRSFIRAHRKDVVSVDEILSQSEITPLNLAEQLGETLALWRTVARRRMHARKARRHADSAR